MWQGKMCVSKRKLFVNEVVLVWNAIVFDVYVFTVFFFFDLHVTVYH
jgi:hypothetical protein